MNAIIVFKYLVCIALVVGILLAPSWLARKGGKDKYNMLIIRISSWLFGWTGVGWLYALWLAVRK